MPWYRCTVNEVGPASDGSETSPPVIYINLTDAAGGFANTWFYAANGIQNQLLDVGIAAINGRKSVQVGAIAPNSGNRPYTEISRIYELRPQPPLAPTEFHLIGLSPSGNPDFYVATVGWKDNSNNEDSFEVRIPPSTPVVLAVPPDRTSTSFNLGQGRTYELYVAAVNSAGEAVSNTITVTVPSATPAASLLAVVQILPSGGVNYGVYIEGSHFGANEMVQVTVHWMVEDEAGALYPQTPVNASSTGYFQIWFTGNTPYGVCPILVPSGQSQPLQRFYVTATGSTSNKTASASAGPFMCPFDNLLP
jgi:hypothetical protein